MLLKGAVNKQEIIKIKGKILQWHIPRRSCFQIELEIRSVGFCGGRKAGKSGEQILELG